MENLIEHLESTYLKREYQELFCIKVDLAIFSILNPHFDGLQFSRSQFVYSRIVAVFSTVSLFIILSPRLKSPIIILSNHHLPLAFSFLSVNPVVFTMHFQGQARFRSHHTQIMAETSWQLALLSSDRKIKYQGEAVTHSLVYVRKEISKVNEENKGFSGNVNMNWMVKVYNCYRLDFIS